MRDIICEFTININGSAWRVELHSHSSREHYLSDAHGACVIEERRVIIRQCSTHQRVIWTLMHELTHAALSVFVGNEVMPLVEEHVCYTMGNALPHIIPQLLSLPRKTRDEFGIVTLFPTKQAAPSASPKKKSKAKPQKKSATKK